VRGGRGLGWSAGRVRVRSVRVRSGFEFCRAGADKKIQPPQDSQKIKAIQYLSYPNNDGEDSSIEFF